MNKHTPGPWSLDLGNIGVDMKNHVAVDAPSHGGIANVVWVMDDDAYEGKNSPECEANARLIAAAPDLLEALKRVVGFWDTLNFDGAAINNLHADARAAIAKAEAANG